MKIKLRLNNVCYFAKYITNRALFKFKSNHLPAEVFVWHPQQRHLYGNTPTKQGQSSNFKHWSPKC